MRCCSTYAPRPREQLVPIPARLDTDEPPRLTAASAPDSRNWRRGCVFASIVCIHAVKPQTMDQDQGENDMHVAKYEGVRRYFWRPLGDDTETLVLRGRIDGRVAMLSCLYISGPLRVAGGIALSVTLRLVEKVQSTVRLDVQSTLPDTDPAAQPQCSTIYEWRRPIAHGADVNLKSVRADPTLSRLSHPSALQTVV